MTLRVCDGAAITGTGADVSECGVPSAGAADVELGVAGVVVLVGVSVSVMLCDDGELAATVAGAGWVVVAGGVVTTGVVESSVVEGGGVPGSDVSVDPSDEPAGSQVVSPVALAAVASPDVVGVQSPVVPGSVVVPVDDPSLLVPSPEVPGSDPVPVVLVSVPVGSLAVVVSVPLGSLLVVSVDPVVLPLVESLVVAGAVVPSSARATCVAKRAGASATATTTVSRAANLRP